MVCCVVCENELSVLSRFCVGVFVVGLLVGVCGEWVVLVGSGMFVSDCSEFIVYCGVCMSIG